MHNFSKLSEGMRKFFFHSSDTFWPAQKLSHHELVCPSRIQISGDFFYPYFWKIYEMFDEMIFWIILLFFFFFIIIIKKFKKVCREDNSHIHYLSNIRQALLFFFQHQTLWKSNKALQNVHWTSLKV